MKNRECSIVRDILPLYVDNVVSEDTKQFIEEHISQCHECKKELELSQRVIPTEEIHQERSNDAEVIKKVKKRLKYKNLIVGITSMILACCVMIITFNALTIPCIVDVSQEKIEIVRVYKLADTSMLNDTEIFWVLHTTPTYDNPAFVDSSITVSEDGKEADMQYMMKVPIINSEIENQTNFNTSNITVYDDYKNIDTLYSGDEIVWTEGTEVPDYVYAQYSDDVSSWNYEVEQDIIHVEYKDGTFIYWDLDGNVLSEGNYKSEY